MSDVRAAVAAQPLWYHTIDLPGGVTTPGVFDLRPVIQRMPWPDVAGRRCLDVGTYDGQLAFELERRGASEVVATDILDHTEWDWPAWLRSRGPSGVAEIAGEEKGAGFEIARDALGSAVRREIVSIYDLDPERLGSFEVVVCGSLLLHLRDPVRALEAVRSVCSGEFLSAETIDLPLLVRHPRRPVARLDGGELLHWWLPTPAAHRRMLEAAGFEVLRSVRPYCIPHGEAHPPRPATTRDRAQRALERLVCRGTGVPHTAALARPRV